MITRTYDGGVGFPSNPGDEKRYGCETTKRQWQREGLLDPATLIPLMFIGVMIAITALAFCLFAFVLWLSRSLVRYSGRSVQIDSEGLHPTEQWENCSPSDWPGRFPDNLKQTRFTEDWSMDFTLYLDHAQSEQLRYGKESKPGRYWDIIMKGLRDTSDSFSSPEYLDVQTLRECAIHSNHRLVIDILISKAREAGLYQVAEVYLKPLTRCDDEISRCESLVSILEPVEVAISTLPNGNFTVVSFFGAVHAILYRCLPPNQSLRKYLEIFSLLTMLLSRALKPYLMRQATYHTKINLLVCLSSASPNRSFALVGFNASAHPDVKKDILEQRRQNLRLLDRLHIHDLPWAVGNCAEAETFAHMESIGKQFPGTATDLHGMVAIIVEICGGLSDIIALRRGREPSLYTKSPAVAFIPTM